jgi:hypothetical protein
MNKTETKILVTLNNVKVKTILCYDFRRSFRFITVGSQVLSLYEPIIEAHADKKHQDELLIKHCKMTTVNIHQIVHR